MKYLYKNTGVVVESDNELDSTMFARIEETIKDTEEIPGVPEEIVETSEETASAEKKTSRTRRTTAKK